MRILVTGSEGHIGRAQVQLLRASGHEVRTFDRSAAHRDAPGEHIPGDLRDILTVRRAVQGMDAVVHLGAIANDRRGHPEDVLSVNVQGTWNLLLACVEADVPRFVFFSSVNALGCVGGHCPPAYLPVDDAYPRNPMSPYQLSKHLAEEACRSFTNKHGIMTLCLRPVFVAPPESYQHYDRHSDPLRRAEHDKRELWAYVDLRDVCDAALRCLTVENVTHDGFLLTADDTTSVLPTAELVDRLYPQIPRKQEISRYVANAPHRSIIDCSHAKKVLGWQPRHSWRDVQTP